MKLNIIKITVLFTFIFFPAISISQYTHLFTFDDTLNDFGIIEFSPDNGITWVLLTTGPNAWPYSINAIPPTFTGNSGGWKYFKLSLSGVDGMYNFQPLDTVQYKFTFISDGNLDNKDGLMFDNLAIWDICTMDLETNNNQNSNAFPNPFTTILSLNYKQLTKGKLFIYLWYDWTTGAF